MSVLQAERELQKACVEATRTEKILEQQMDTFEQKKVEDVKVSWLSPLVDFIR